MSVTAMYLFLKVRNHDQMKFVAALVYFGSLLFWMSDNVLAQENKNKAINDEWFKKIMGYTVGVTYWLAQFFICEGVAKIRQVDNISNINSISNNNTNGNSKKI